MGLILVDQTFEISVFLLVDGQRSAGRDDRQQCFCVVSAV